MFGLLGLASGTLQASVPAPPVAPPWWNSQTAPWWGYGYWDGTTTVVERSPGDNFAVSWNITSTSLTLDVANGYGADLQKTFFVYITGTGADTIATAPILSGINYSEPSSSVSYVLNTASRDTSGNWTVLSEGVAVPQPDLLELTLQISGSSMQMTSWWVGEMCTAVPEPSTTVLLGTGFMAIWCLRRHCRSEQR